MTQSGQCYGNATGIWVRFGQIVKQIDKEPLLKYGIALT